MADARQVNSNARRLRGSITRVEQTPYDATSSRRLPRAMPTVFEWGYCQLTASLGPPTGTWPTLTSSELTGQTVYKNVGAAMTSQGTFKVKNWRNVTWAANKTSVVIRVAGDTYEIIDQDC